MIVELKKGYTIESRYDKFTDSYITRLIDPDGKQVKDARYSDDMVDRNYDIQDIKDYFNNYVNIGLSEREGPERDNMPYEPEEDDEFPELEPEETFEDEEDMFDEALDPEIKKKARKTKIATRKSKLPALSKLSPIMPDQAKGIAKFNAMQPDGNSGMMSTTGSTSLGEEYMSRDLLIDKIRNMGYKYNFDKYTDAQLYRIYQERVETAKKRAAKRAERQRRAAEEDNKRENAKDSYFKDGIEFESEEAAKEYFGEAMEQKVYLNSLHEAWDIVEDFEESVYPVEFTYTHETDDELANFFSHVNVKATSEEEALRKAEDYIKKGDKYYQARDFRIGDTKYTNVDLVESFNKSSANKNNHNFKTLDEGFNYFNHKAFDRDCEDIGIDLMFESVRDKLTKDDIKKLGALMNKTDDPDDVVTYVKGLLSEDLDNKVKITYRKSGYGGFTTDGEEVNIRNYADKFDEVVGDISGIYVAILLHSNIGHSYYDKIIFSNSLDDCKKAANDWLYSSDKGSLSYYDEHYYAMIVDLAKDQEIAHGDTWYSEKGISKGWRDFPLKEDFDLDQFKDNLEREKDYYGSRAQGLKMLAYPLNNKIMRAAEKAHLWVDEEGCVIDDLKDEIQLSFYVDGDWKHDHARFDMLVREIVYDMGMDLNGYYQEDESDDGSDNYRSLHVFEIDASKQNKLSESLTEALHTMAIGDIDMALDRFEEICRDKHYPVEVTGSGVISEDDGDYYLISGYIEDKIASNTNPSEILDILIKDLDMFDIPVDVSTDWQVTRLYRRMVFEISTKEPLVSAEEREDRTVRDFDSAFKKLIEVLEEEGFILDESVTSIKDNLFGGKHLQVINPNMYFPTSETEGEEITEEEAYKLFLDDLKPILGVLDDFEEGVEDAGIAYMTYNFGANDKGQITAGLDLRPIKRRG